MDTIEKIILLYLIIINIVAFLLYGIDKRKAVRKKWRIPEFWLIALAVIGGPFGAFLGMLVFHHKTKKMKFRVTVPFFILIWITVIVLMVLFR